VSSFFDAFFRARARRQTTPEEFERSFLSLMQLMTAFLGTRGYLKYKIRIMDLKLRKYSASHVNPLRPLTPISSVDEISVDEMLYMYVSLESDTRATRAEEFFGNFRVDESGRLIPEGYDDQEITIYPDDVEKDEKSLKKEAVEFLREHRQEMWQAIVLLANLVLDGMKRASPSS